MGLRHVAAATVLILAGTTLAVAPASASPGLDRRDGSHYPVSVTSEVPAGGSTMITTPTIPRDAASVKVTVGPRNPSVEEDDIYDHFMHSLGSMAKGKRLVVCVMMYQLLNFPDTGYNDELEFNAFHATLAGAVLLGCLRMAGLLQSSSEARSGKAAASTACGQIRPSLPASLEQVDGGWSLSASGTTRKAKRPKLKVGCREKGNKTVYKVRAAKKGVPVRKVVGKKLMVGMQSPADASTSVPVKVTLDVLQSS